MPNYTLTSTAQFKPLTYDEIAKAGEYIENLHKEAEDKYTLLNTTAAEYENMANEQTDPLAAAMYKQYAAKLALAADDLAKNGYTASTNRTIGDLTAEFQRKVNPIKTAYEAKQKQIEERNKMIQTDDSYITSDDPNNLSLDDLILNPSLNLNKQAISGRKIAKDVSDMAANLAREINTNANVREMIRQILPYQYRMLEEGKYSSEDVYKAILEDPKASPILDKIIEQGIESSGVLDWQYSSDADKKRVLQQVINRAQEGIWSAVGQSKYHYLKDDFSMQEELLKRKAKADKEEEPPQIEGPRIVPETLWSKNERSLLNNYKQYFEEKLQPDGSKKHVLTDEGLSELYPTSVQVSTNYTSYGVTGGYGPMKRQSAFYSALQDVAKELNYVNSDDEFKTLVNVAKGNIPTSQEKQSYPEIASLTKEKAKAKLEEIYNTVYNPNDMVGRQRYRVDVDSDNYGETIKKNINYALSRGGVKLQEVEFNAAEGEYKLGSSEVSSLSKDDKVVGTAYSKHGAVVIVWKDGDPEKQVEYRIPKGVNDDAANARDEELRKAHLLYYGASESDTNSIQGINKFLQSFGDLNEESFALLPEESKQAYSEALKRKIQLEQLYKHLIESANLHHSQLFFDNKTEEQKYKVFQQG